MATMGGTGDWDESRAWIQRNLAHADEPGLGVFVFRDRLTGEFVGRGAIRRVEIGGADEVEIGYAVAADLWGRGLATELGRWLVDHAERRDLQDLVAFTLGGNAASRRVMEKLGFGYERDVVWHGSPHVLYRRPGSTPTGPSA
jgi:RimJ/RimL family protein N-acetyltransferase